MTESTENRWSAHIARLKDDPAGKPLGLSVALASEIFRLMAENKRLQLALQKRGVIDHADVIAAGESAEFRKWLQAEQSAFTRSIFKPWLDSDESPDVSGEFEREASIKI